MTQGRTVPLVAAMLLTGCHGDSNPAAAVMHFNPKPASAVPVKRGPTPQEMTAGMVEAVAIGKSNVPIDIKFDLAQRPALGQSLDVVIAVMPQVLATTAQVKVGGSGGLQISPAARSIEIAQLDPMQVYRFTVPVTPTADGVQMLSLGITMNVDDSTLTKTFTVPIIVENPATAATTANPAGALGAANGGIATAPAKAGAAH